MHDRRIDGQAHVFGNQGGLFLRAMVWWDHETGSLWSQPTDIAIHGDYAGVQLAAIPAAIEPWEAWLDAHPETLVLEDTDRILERTDQPTDPFAEVPERQVVGIAMGGLTRAYRVQDVAKQGVVNDVLGGVPLLVYANGETGSVHIYVRAVGTRELTFLSKETKVLDHETGSVWDPALGLAVEGPLAGEALKEIPFTSAFDWAWDLHYPDSDFYPER